jgi:phage repressor protein C with HTH and peptisase S24 domain
MKRIILLLFIVVNLSALPPVKILAYKELIKENNEWVAKGQNYTAIVGTGKSMLPYLKNGDTLLVQKRKFNTSIYLGDFTCFTTRDGKSGCHEVIEVRGNMLLLKGMNNDRADGWFAQHEIHWIVRKVLRQKYN